MGMLAPTPSLATKRSTVSKLNIILHDVKYINAGGDEAGLALTFLFKKLRFILSNGENTNEEVRHDNDSEVLLMATDASCTASL